MYSFEIRLWYIKQDTVQYNTRWIYCRTDIEWGVNSDVPISDKPSSYEVRQNHCRACWHRLLSHSFLNEHIVMRMPMISLRWWWCWAGTSLTQLKRCDAKEGLPQKLRVKSTSSLWILPITVHFLWHFLTGNTAIFVYLLFHQILFFWRVISYSFPLR